MPQSIAHLTLVVRNYDEALAFYTQKLGFHLIQDTPLPGNKRWLLVAPPRSRGVRFLETPRQESYGTVAVFEDLYGNKWDLLQPAAPIDRPTNRD